MPLPRDGEYPYKSKPDWRLAILQSQVDEARRVACEQYTRAIRMKRERDEANDAYREFYSRWAKAEREKLLLLEALKKLWEVSHGYYLQEWMDIIDAALDGVE